MEIDSNATPAATLNAIADAAAATESTTEQKAPQTQQKKKQPEVEQKDLAKLPEGDVYVSLLVVIWLMDNGDYSKVRRLA